MRKSRGYRENPDLSQEDRDAAKYSRQSGRRREKHLTDDMASHHRHATEDRHSHRHNRQGRHSHDKYATDEDVAHSSARESRSRHSHRHTDDVGSDSSDEILIKHRGSRRLRREDDKDAVSRQLKNIEKVQREALRPSSSASQEIHVHYVPVITTSASPPITSSRQSRSLDSAASNSDGRSSRKSKSHGISASELTGQLRELTLSWITKRNSPSKSSRRSKHEKLGKHGKKRTTSKFLAPLAQRWICYDCGKLRSDTIQYRHPLKEGQKMQPNWCGRCRVHRELEGRPLDWHGQRHYCWGCGIVRSKDYHRDNPIAENERSTPNYCRRCRELSPSFDYNLREASEVGSEVSIRDQAFQRQMHDAELSDIEEDEHEATSAPGKENENPNKSRKVRYSESFILQNCALSTKTASDGSSEGSLPIGIINAMRLDADKARPSADGGCRLSTSSYNPPTVESVCGGDQIAGTGFSGEPRQISNERDEYEPGGAGPVMDKDLRGQCSSQGRTDSPTILAPNQRAFTAGSIKKKVHWCKEDNRPSTSDNAQPYHSDSGFSSGYRSDLSRSTGSRGRRRRHPAEESTGSPPEREGVVTSDGLSDGAQNVWEQRETLTQRSDGDHAPFGHSLPSQGTVEQPTRAFGTEMPQCSREPALSGIPQALPLAPPESYDPITGGYSSHSGDFDGQNVAQYWNSTRKSPRRDIPNFSRPYQSPTDPRTNDVWGLDPGSEPSQGYDAYNAFVDQPYPSFNSATNFSDSTTRRDFSGYAAPADADFGIYSSPEDGYGYDARQDGESCFAAYGGKCPFPAPPGYPAFDFSNIGNTNSSKTCSDGFYTHVPEGTGETFVRHKKFTRSSSNKTQTPRSQQGGRASWHLYDDGDADEHERSDFEWRDGQTTVHRHRAQYATNSGNRVTILSIREIESDEELSEANDGEDDNDDSDAGTVINNSMKSICAA